MQEQYPELTLYRYEAVDPTYQPLMRRLAESHDALRYLGNVPLTFVGDSFVLGFESDRTTGHEIEMAIRRELGLSTETASKTPTFHVPFLGTIRADTYSLPALAVILGSLDGFNVCSLGALVLIIGLALKLQRRRAIVLFGGTFLVTTAVVYGALIVAWYHVFDLFSGYLTLMKMGIALLSLGGGLYFLKEWLRMHKQRAVCEFSESPLIRHMTERTGRAFEDNTKLVGMLVAVLVFAAVVAIVEFPCSAAVPVVFAGVLANAGLSTIQYLLYIGLFLVFYLFDEILVFSIAAYRLKIWMTSGRFTKWAVLIEAAVLLSIGAWYLAAITGVL